MPHPYARIVAELQRRIATGELRPGDRVPSTRQLTQEWGVAMATATKALSTLRQQGLVRAVQGVGTVVADGRRAPRAEPEQELTRERVVAAAIQVADAEGMANVSMRRIATELGVATMSLYRHVPGKEELVVLMVDTAIAEESLPETPPDGWRARLELSSRLQWRLYRKHRWLAPAISMTRPQALPNALNHTEWSLRALAGVEPKARLYAYLTVFGYVRGVAMNLEAEAQAEQDTRLTPDEWMDTQEDFLKPLVDSGRLPAFAELVTHDIDFELEDLFEFGLARVLDGLEKLVVPPMR
ncbi:TetR/AcrR family transcriptional regulator C-terminal domain-containing protein [Amycolatopsis acidiphila]|uniref:GntR family transcriptional regulator n=1 Tax=Amycolatopsis acidiphila TaxID=715473 RepID=A0A558AHH3_9PSEU|nr:TetR/AcrR family transcriptional regulator C-terminal domain-containing protein [Amycolatopsis acidiphila]TVT23700.1 GntR family transcriptional regulator [Amycolatopsis acidiphila]UIJ58693.1 TetR/AcrR family transcriptional regulator C-terminal domain-containing protein [Amycolatopsis acidiphila]GHG75998.1 GntR family transcriptional regulator [Amycolatopsis acidiphila]